MPTHRDIIKNNGGARAVAEALRVRTETVRMWLFRERIPRTAWPELIQAFPTITLDALLAAESVEAA